MTALDTAPATRRCTGCGADLPIDRFYFQAARRVYRSHCRACTSSYERARGLRRRADAPLRERGGFSPGPPPADHQRCAESCDRCGAAVSERWWSRHCSRACLLLSVGLPADWVPTALDGATEAQVRGVLGALFAAGRTDLLATAGGAR